MPAAPDAIAHSAQTLVNDLPVPDYALSDRVTAVDGRPHYDGDPKTLLSQCTALCNIRFKAERGEALNRSEAFHFANAMLSVSGGEGCVHETMRLSFGQKYDQQLCQKEIDNILPLRPTNLLYPAPYALSIARTACVRGMKTHWPPILLLAVSGFSQPGVDAWLTVRIY